MLIMLLLTSANKENGDNQQYTCIFKKYILMYKEKCEISYCGQKAILTSQFL